MITEDTPKNNAAIATDGLTPQEVLVYILTACQTLLWKVTFVSYSGAVAEVYNYETDKNDTLYIKVAQDMIVVASHDMQQHNEWHYHLNRFTASFYTQRGLGTGVVEAYWRNLEPQLSQEVNEALDAVAFTDTPAKPEPAPPPAPFTDFRGLFLPSKEYMVTPIIMYLNILVYIAMLIAGVHFMEPSGEALYKWGANYGPATLNGEWWRIITCVFVHIGVIHLLMNMYALMFVGILLEPILGRVRFIAIYLFTGIIASLTSVYTHPETLSAGASGAVFGLYGILLSLLFTNVLDKSVRKTMMPSILLFVGYNLVYGFTKTGIDNAAHIGGLVSGFLGGYIMYYSLKNKTDVKLRVISISSLLIIALASGYFVMGKASTSLKIREEDFGRYQRGLDSFSRFEKEALQVYELPDSMSKEQKLTAIAEDGITNWEKCAGVLNRIGNLDLPPDALTLNQNLKQYVTLRTEMYELRYKGVRDETTIYNAKIRSLDSSTTVLLEEMKVKEK